MWSAFKRKNRKKYEPQKSRMLYSTQQPKRRHSFMKNSMSEHVIIERKAAADREHKGNFRCFCERDARMRHVRGLPLGLSTIG